MVSTFLWTPFSARSIFRNSGVVGFDSPYDVPFFQSLKSCRLVTCPILIVGEFCKRVELGDCDGELNQNFHSFDTAHRGLKQGLLNPRLENFVCFCLSTVQ